MKETVFYLVHVYLTLYVGVHCDWPCLYPLPCTCDYVHSMVECSHKSLTNIPPIANYLTGKEWYIDLSYNNITTVLNGTFGNITIASLDLNHNQIASMGDNIFQGSEDIMFSLYLHFNNLQELPPAVGKLSKLYELTIHGNPISKLDTTIFSTLAPTLNQLSFGSSALKSWPELKQFTKGTWLTVYGINLETIPENAFQDNIFSLNITGSSIKTLSSTLNDKPKFVELDLQDDPNLTANGLTEGGFHNLPALRALRIINCGLETLPPIFNELRGLGEIILKGNPIKTIPDNTFPVNFIKIFQIFIQDSLLDHVPAALSRLTNINNVYLNNGRISSITDKDFHGLIHMYSLYLTGNPLSNISDNAFKSLKGLNELYLDNTFMTTVPKAIRNTPYLNTLDMTNSKVECSCGSLGWLKNWLSNRRKLINFAGMCHNISKSLHDFIVNDIPKCNDI